MTRGTTPVLEFTIPFQTSLIKTCYVTFNQNGVTVLEKDKDHCEFSGTKITVTLTQEETLLFSSGDMVEIQIAIRTTDESAFRSEIKKVGVNRILKDGVI